MVATSEKDIETETKNELSREIRIAVLDNIANEGHEILEKTAGVVYEVHTGLAGQELAEILQRFDGAVCRSGVKITAESLEGNNRLKAIARAGVGTDNIDKTAATRNGIVVMNTPGGNTISTAEHTIALMLGLSRNIAPGPCKFVGRQMGSQKIFRQSTGWQNPGRDWIGTNWPGSVQSSDCVWDESHRF